MNRGIYSTGSGMIACQKWLDVVADKIANSSTIGFKRDGVSFNDVFIRKLHADGGYGAQVGSIGSGPVELKQFTVFEKGSLTETSNPFDVAIIADKGMFAVQTQNGVRYTRAGNFTMNAERQLVTMDGNLVLSDNLQPIEVPDGGQINISPDGSVSVGEQTAGRIGVFEGNFKKSGRNLFVSNDAQPLENQQLRPGAIENANVNPVEAMLELIQINRTFELAQRSITQQDELTQRLIQSLRNA